MFPKTVLAHEYKDTLNSKFAIGPNIVMLSGHSWKSQRKVANPAFRRSVPIKLFGNLAQELFKSMETMDESVNFSDLMERWTLEVIGKAGFGFEFNAIHDRDSEWVTRYNKLSDALRDPLFFLFPALDTKFRWLFPQRQKIHQEMKLFSNMLSKIIQHKKEMIKNGVKNDALEDNERDLLSLMIESGEEDNEALSDEELMVKEKNTSLINIILLTSFTSEQLVHILCSWS